MTATTPQTKESILALLESNDLAVQRGIVAIWKRQTDEEQRTLQTHEHNNVGFSGFDAELLSSFVEQLQRGKLWSPKQWEIARKRVRKYAQQLADIANEKAGLPKDDKSPAKPRIVYVPPEEDKVWNKATDGYSHGYYADMSELEGNEYVAVGELTDEIMVRTHGNVWTELRRFVEHADNKGEPEFTTRWTIEIGGHTYTIFND